MRSPRKRVSGPPRLTRWELLGAWLHIWTPPKDVPVPPLPRRKAAAWALALLAATGVGLALLIPPLERGKRAGAARLAAEQAAIVAAETARLRADQAIHRASGGAGTPLVRQLEQAVTADARARAAAHTLDGPVVDTQCAPAGRSVVLYPGSRVYTCFVATAANRAGARGDRFSVGYEFVATIYFGSRRLAWCKENPRPGEKTGGHGIAHVPLSPECAGVLAKLI
jgi:hypothetical protein